MKKLLLLSLSCVLALLGSCEDPKPDPVNPTGTMEVAYNLSTPEFTSVTLNVNSKNVTQIAYLVSAEPTATAPTAEELFDNANATIVTVTDGSNSILIKNLESETAYKLFVASQAGVNEYGAEVWTKDFTTSAFTQLVTMLPADDMFSLKFHINVPANCTLNYNVVEMGWYYDKVSYYGGCDAMFLEGHEGNSTSDATLNLITESQTITFRGWGDPESTDENDPFINVTPGQALQLIVGEVEYSGQDNYDRRLYKAKFDFESWIAAGIENNADPYWLTEYWSSERVHPNSPETVAGIEADVQIITHTTKTISFGITPHEDMRMVAIAAYDVPGLEHLYNVLGENGFINFHSGNSYIYENDPFSFEFSGMVEGTDYKLVIVGNLTGDGSQQSIQMIDFAPSTATADAPEIIVTGIDAPAGEVASPWEVWFNIKAPNGDASKFVYVMNDTREFHYLLNDGVLYNTIISNFGTIVTDFTALDYVNSEEGYSIKFPAWEDTQYRLVVAGVNEEEVISDVDASPTCIADYWSGVMEDAPRVESDLFNSLQGEWYAEVRGTQFVDGDGNTLETPLVMDVRRFPVKISAGTPEYPATLPAEVYDLYPSMTTEEVDALYADFKASAEKYDGKVRGQNRLLIEGFYAEPNAWADAYAYETPYDLFISTNYSQAVTVNDLFYDFGPKWYIEIAEGDALTIPVDLSYIGPMINNRVTAYHYGVAADGTSYAATLSNFPATLSDDKNTITIGSTYMDIEVEGVGTVNQEFLFSVGEFDETNGGALPAIVCSELKLIRGTMPVEPAPAPRSFNYAPITNGDYVPTKAYRGTSLKGIKNYDNYVISTDEVPSLENRKDYPAPLAR